MGILAGGNFLSSPACDNGTALIAAFWTEVDDMVCARDDVEVMFDDDDRVALFDKPAEKGQQPFSIFEMKSRRRFIEEKESRAGRWFQEYVDEAEALSFAS